MSITCFTCQLAVPEEEEGAVVCTECTHSYHFGKCSGVTKKSFSGKNEAAKKSWRCPQCRCSASRASGSEDSQSELDIKFLLASINKKLESLPSLNEKVDRMEQSVQHMSNRFDELEKQLKHQATEIKDLNKKVRELEKKDETNRAIRDQLQQAVNELEFRSRRLNLEVHGITMTQGENLLFILNEVADKLELPHLTESDVVSAHRLPAKQGLVPGIIVHFMKQQSRDAWLKRKSKLKNSAQRIFIQENLTRYNRELLRAAKDRAKENSYAYTWCTNGKVLVRKTEGARPIHIRTNSDLDQIK